MIVPLFTLVVKTQTFTPKTKTLKTSLETKTQVSRTTVCLSLALAHGTTYRSMSPQHYLFSLSEKRLKLHLF